MVALFRLLLYLRNCILVDMNLHSSTKLFAMFSELVNLTDVF